MREPVDPTQRTSQRVSWTPWLIGGLLVGVAFFYWVNRNGPDGPIPDIGRTNAAVGKQLETLELQPLTGAERPLGIQDLQGKVTLINYWGTWCPPCLVEFPHIVQLHERFAAQPAFQLVSVSCGRGTDEDLERLRVETENFLDRTGASLPIYADTNGTSRLGLMETVDDPRFAYPTTVLLDDQQVIRALWQGYSSGFEREMETLVQQLLTNRP